jgi:hypothetical protein
MELLPTGVGLNFSSNHQNIEDSIVKGVFSTDMNIAYHEIYPPLVIYKDIACQTDCSYIKTSSSFYTRITTTLFKFLSIYILFCCVCMYFPSIQYMLIYCNHIRIPGVNLSNLKLLGLNQAININITTMDGLMLKGWHLLPPCENAIISSTIYNQSIEIDFFENNLQSADRIIIFFHGIKIYKYMYIQYIYINIFL